MAEQENLSLNLNPARADKFFFALGNIPSLQLLAPVELDTFKKEQLVEDEKNYFHLAIRGLELPDVSLGENKIDNMFTSVADVDNKFTFGTFTTELKLDNNYLIYKMMILWMFLINRPDEFNQFGSGKMYEKTSSEGILTVNDNFNNPVITFDFIDLRPIAIPSLPLTFTGDGDELVLNVTWSYTYFMPRKANGEKYLLDI